MTAAQDNERPRCTAADYAAAYLAAIERAMRERQTTVAMWERARRLEAIRGHRRWAREVAT